MGGLWCGVWVGGILFGCQSPFGPSAEFVFDKGATVFNGPLANGKPAMSLNESLTSDLSRVCLLEDTRGFNVETARIRIMRPCSLHVRASMYARVKVDCRLLPSTSARYTQHYGHGNMNDADGTNIMPQAGRCRSILGQLCKNETSPT